MDTLINGLVWGELVARRSKALKRGDRDRIRLRTGALALAGLPPVVGLADATREVRRIEKVRRQPVEAKPGLDAAGGFSFRERGAAIVDEFTSLAEVAMDEVEHAGEELKSVKTALKEHEELVKEAKADARQLAECAAALQAVFEDDAAG